MDPVIIVSGKWVLNNRYSFSHDKRGCRVLHITEETSFLDLLKMVVEDYGLDEQSCKIQLSYMFSNQTLKKMPRDTPPVYICNSRQLQGFLSLRSSEVLRLCVEVTDKEGTEVIQKDKAKDKLKETKEDYRGRYEAEEVHNYEDLDSNDGIYEKEDKVEDDEDDEFDSRFDIFDDPDGASSDDDNFSLFGKPREEDEVSPTLPPKKRLRDIPKLDMSSLKIAVGQRYESKDELEKILKLLTLRDQFDFDVPISRPDILVVKCWVEGCSWRVRASTEGKSPEFYIRLYDSEHTCSITERSSRSRQATPDILGPLYRDLIGDIDPSVRPRHVGVAITKQFGIKVIPYIVSSITRLIYVHYGG